MNLTRNLHLSAGEAAVAALMLVSAGIQWNDGQLSRIALAYVSLAVVCCIWSLRSDNGRLRWFIPGVALIYEIQALLTSLPLVGAEVRTAFHVLIWAASAAAIAGCSLPGVRGRRVAMLAAITGVFACGILMLSSTPRPPVDVWDLHQEASKALLHGSNPYHIRIRDIYTPEYSRRFYGPGTTLSGHLLVGFPYPPVSLYISFIGYLVAGDVRYAHLAAICLSALLLGFCGRTRASTMGALLFLFCPRVFFVLDGSWTEPVVVLLFSLMTFARCRSTRLGPWLAGLVLTGKQYMIFTAPALLRKWRDLPKAALVGFVVTAPLLLWDVREFFNSAVFFHFEQPTRPDALSYMGLLMRYNIELPGWVPFALTVAAWVYVVRRAPEKTSEICRATSLLLIVFFVFNKSAFCNYYYLVIGTLGAAIASLEPKNVRKCTS